MKDFIHQRGFAVVDVCNDGNIANGLIGHDLWVLNAGAKVVQMPVMQGYVMG